MSEPEYDSNYDPDYDPEKDEELQIAVAAMKHAAAERAADAHPIRVGVIKRVWYDTLTSMRESPVREERFATLVEMSDGRGGSLDQQATRWIRARGKDEAPTFHSGTLYPYYVVRVATVTP